MVHYMYPTSRKGITIMTIGNNIRTLRQKQNMTQEQLAELLHISPSAVSQWECDRVLPDVTQIPVLSGIFHVSADVILGIDRERDSERIEEALAAAREHIHAGEFRRAAELLEEAHRRYPTSFRIMEQLANVLVSVYSREGKREYDDVIRLCQKILDECTDSMLRYRALVTMAQAYSYAGNRDEMRRTADQMPPMAYSREAFMLWHWDMKGKEGLEKRQEYLYDMLIGLTEVMGILPGMLCDDGKPVYSHTERITMYGQIVSLIELLFPDGDYGFLAQEAIVACSMLVNICMHRGDTEGAIHWLQKGGEFVRYTDTYSPDAPHTSPVLKGYGQHGWIRENGQSKSDELLQYLREDPDSLPIRDDPRIQELIKTLQKTASAE